jgi:predicted ArsR family transcriptional regulator
MPQDRDLSEETKRGRSGAETGARIVLLLLTGYWPATASKIAERLGVSESYVRRILHHFDRRGITVSTVTEVKGSNLTVRTYALAGYGFGAQVIPPGVLPCLRNNFE